MNDSQIKNFYSIAENCGIMGSPERKSIETGVKFRLIHENA